MLSNLFLIDLKFFVVLPTSPEKIIKKCLLFKLRDKYNDLALFFKHLFRERKRDEYIVYIQRNNYTTINMYKYI